MYDHLQSCIEITGKEKAAKIKIKLFGKENAGKELEGDGLKIYAEALKAEAESMTKDGDDEN